MRTLRVLCYADTTTAVPHCAAAAEMLRVELGAHIIMLLERGVRIDETLSNSEIYWRDGLFVPSKHVRNSSEGTNKRKAAALTSRRIELFGFRNVLARSKLLRYIYSTIRRLYLILRNPPSLLRQARSWIRRISILAIAAELIWARQRAKTLREFLRKIRPDVILLVEDNVETLSTTVINEGCRQGIPSVIVPFTIPNPLEPAKFYRHRKLNQVNDFLSRLVVRIFPKWRYRLDGQDLIRVPAFTALALEALGQSSPAPWILNRGRAAKIALDSESQRDRYVQLGFPVSQLAVVGDIHSAILYRAAANRARLRLELMTKYSFVPDRPLIVCGFPPNQFGGEDDGQFEFSSYDTLSDAWIESFRSLGNRANVLIRPHPRASADRFSSFAGGNIRCSMQPTAELIPLCDLYVASISATIRWAIACGIPVINYDTYRYRYDDYEGVGGVIHVDLLADFRVQLERFVDDASFAECVSRKQREVMRRWGVLDDGLSRRFAMLVNEVTEGVRSRSVSGQ
ncbi:MULTISPECIES: hypothetical protein [unclassified Bradyrhizobium]|jgi:hypothetical protein|uniref:hypothetical protein n=1 Tax=unclassified Bradyrhizobium TaxID=2631580 RepID=UPI000AF43218|nr:MULTISPECIES: hypothetical protein [unclassified Bradyrhizobium]